MKKIVAIALAIGCCLAIAGCASSTNMTAERDNTTGAVMFTLPEVTEAVTHLSMPLEEGQGFLIGVAVDDGGFRLKLAGDPDGATNVVFENQQIDADIMTHIEPVPGDYELVVMAYDSRGKVVVVPYDYIDARENDPDLSKHYAELEAILADR